MSFHREPEKKKAYNLINYKKAVTKWFTVDKIKVNVQVSILHLST